MRLNLLRIVTLLVLPTLLLGATSAALGGGRATDAPVPSAILDNQKALSQAIKAGREVTVIVELADAPLASYAGGIRGIGRTKPASGRKLDKRSSNALGYARFLADKRTAFKAFLRANAGSAVVEAEYDTVLNGLALTLSGRDLQRVLNAPGVKAVSVDREFRPLMNISRSLIGGPAIDAVLPGMPGEGILIGIIDTGIQRAHPFFDATGYDPLPDPDYPMADNLTNQIACTSNKIVVARAYPKPPGADSCIDTNGHGTHVSGTAAGNTSNTATVQGVSIGGMSGIAHRARLGNYNVFPNLQASARSVEIIRAIEDGVSDGMDVLNMSLGGGVHQPEQGDPLAQAVNNAAAANVVVAVAAGNSGPGLFTVSSPGNASGALTAGASTNPHFVGQPVSGVACTGTPCAALTVGGAVGDFNPYPATTSSWLSFGTNLGCVPATVPAPTAVTQIAVIPRGTCTFTTKIRNALNAGFDGVIVRNNVAGDPVAMAHDGTDPFPAIPAVMIRSGAILSSPGTATILATFAEFITPNADILAGFSSRGPVPFDERLKPDVSAPGVNVLSSTVDPIAPGFDWAFFQGTSMATPHLAGAAALLRQLKPTWTPEQIKSALVTRAKRPVFFTENPVNRGGGRVNLDTAKDVNVTFSPPNFSFGQIKPKAEAQSVSRSTTFTNVTPSSTLTWSVGTISPCAVSIGGTIFTIATFIVSTSTGASSGTVAPGASITIVITATTVGGAPDGVLCSGDVSVSTTGQTMPPHRVPWILVHAKNALLPP